jgi:predicted DNA-binding WGR domain protein
MPTIHRRNPARNEARFYAVSLQADLLEGWSVVREWGRIGRPGRVRVDRHGDAVPAQAAAERVVRRKRGRGIGDDSEEGTLLTHPPIRHYPQACRLSSGLY